MELREFFRRQQLGFQRVDRWNWEPAACVNIDPYLFAPVLAGHWKQHELWDETYTLDDLFDIHELMSVHDENIQRAEDAHKREMELDRAMKR